MRFLSRSAASGAIVVKNQTRENPSGSVSCSCVCRPSFFCHCLSRGLVQKKDQRQTRRATKEQEEKAKVMGRSGAARMRRGFCGPFSAIGSIHFLCIFLGHPLLHNQPTTGRGITRIEEKAGKGPRRTIGAGSRSTAILPDHQRRQSGHQKRARERKRERKKKG